MLIVYLLLIQWQEHTQKRASVAVKLKLNRASASSTRVEHLLVTVEHESRGVAAVLDC